jgi:hypothetical protein
MSTARDALLSFARCFGVNDHKAVYVSTPITTGQSFLTWRRQNPSLVEAHPGYATNHRQQVVEANLARAEQVVRQVRAAFAGVVIDPTKLDDVDGWRQPDYHEFWADVVANFAHTVVFVNGWYYSSGCALEFATAVRHRLTLLDENLHALDPQRGIRLLTEAADELVSAGLEEAGTLARAADEAKAAVASTPQPR